MARPLPTLSPLDRALQEVEQRRAQLERDTRQLLAAGQPAPAPRGTALGRWLKDVFTLPGRRPPTGPLRRDLFEPAANNPMPLLDPAPPSPRPDSDLFQHAERTRLAQYLLREYFPLHDAACAEEGRLLLAYSRGEPDAARRIADGSGRVPAIYRRLRAG